MINVRVPTHMMMRFKYFFTFHLKINQQNICKRKNIMNEFQWRYRKVTQFEL